MGQIDLFQCCNMVLGTPFSIFCDPCNIFYVWDGFNTSNQIWSHGMGGKWKKQNSDLSPHFNFDLRLFEVLKIPPKAQIWYSLGPGWGIGIWKVVSKGLFVFPKQIGGAKFELVQKKSFLPWNHKVKPAISSTAIYHPKTATFLNFFWTIYI